MKTIQNVCSIFCLLLFFSVSTFAGLPLKNFNGKFKNENASTRGITQINLVVSGASVKAQTFGSCSPKDCDWGVVKGTPFTNSVSAKVQNNTEAIQFIYKKGHAVTTLIVTPAGRNRIAVRSLTKFRDGSNRSAYTSIAYFRKTVSVRPVTLAAPQQNSRCGQTYNNFPRRTNVSWKAVRGASKYIVEVDCFHCCKSGKWCTQVGKSWKKETVKGTRYSFNFVGAQPGRWRVRAVDSKGKPGKVSPWCNFKYTK
ncbi:MAG: hypothetical protein AAF990_08095 [Bacteroidota bacterium]